MTDAKMGVSGQECADWILIKMSVAAHREEAFWGKNGPRYEMQVKDPVLSQWWIEMKPACFQIYSRSNGSYGVEL